MDYPSQRASDGVCVVGDFCLSDARIASELHALRISPWSGLRALFGHSTTVVANLECPFTNHSHGLPFKWANLKAPLDLHWTLDSLSLAILGNNHIADFGVQGIRDTLALLARKGISSVGYGETLAAALKPALLDVGGHTLGVVSLCCPTTNSENLATHITPGVAPIAMATIKQAVEGARQNCDALIAYFHWGCEWVHDPAPDQLRLARHAIDCGADAVVGCHSHTIQSYEQYRGRWSFYGLGNYLFTVAQAQRVDDKGAVEYIPLTLKPANRESLAVFFNVVRDTGSGRLRLTAVQPMRFGDDWVPRAISHSALSFDLEAANARLSAYVERSEVALRERSEPVYRTQVRNGTLAHWYTNNSITTSPRRFCRALIRRVLRRLIPTVQTVLLRLRQRAGCRSV